MGILEAAKPAVVICQEELGSEERARSGFVYSKSDAAKQSWHPWRSCVRGSRRIHFAIERRTPGRVDGPRDPLGGRKHACVGIGRDSSARKNNSTAWSHGAGNGQELSARYRHDAEQPGCVRLAHDPPQLSGLELQPFESDQCGKRQRPKTEMDLGYERKWVE